MADTDTRYDTDIVAWSEQQATALRRRAANELDWDNVAEEIESLGISERRELESRIETILDHLPPTTQAAPHAAPARLSHAK